MFGLGACGGMVMTRETPDFLFSPGWPDNYPHNLECTWLIRSPDSTVEFNLLSLDIEDYPMCYFDSLVIRDGKLWKLSRTRQSSSFKYLFENCPVLNVFDPSAACFNLPT